MKEHMMIIGAEIIRSPTENADGLMELTLVPLTLVKQKAPKLTDMLGGGMEAIMKNAQEWVDKGYKIARHVTLEMKPDDTTGGVQ